MQILYTYKACMFLMVNVLFTLHYSYYLYQPVATFFLIPTVDAPS